MTSNQEKEPSRSSGSLYGAGQYGQSPYGSYGYGAPYQGPSQAGGLSFSLILRILKRFWYLNVIFCVLGGAGAYYLLSKMIPLYEASTLVEMSVRKPRILNTESAVLDDGYGRSGSEEIMNSRISRLRSSSVRAMVIDTFRESYPQSKATDSEIKDAVKKTNIVRNSHSRMLVFRGVDADPELAANVVNAYTKSAEFAVYKENKEASDQAVEWLQVQAEKKRALLDASEQGLLDYRNRNQLDTLENEKNSIHQSSLVLSEKLVEIESDTVLVREMLKFIDEVKDDPAKVAELPAEAPGRLEIMAAISRLRTAISERNLLLAKYTPNHPDMVRRSEHITDLGKQLLKESDRARASVANSLKIKSGQVNSLRQTLVDQAKRISEIELQTVRINSELNALMRERDATKISYEGILKRIEEARLASDEETTIVSVIETAAVPEKPVSPNRPRILAMGLIGGLFVGFALGFLIEFADDRVKSLGDIEQMFGLRVLGIVPRIRKIQRHELALASLNNKFGHITEAFAGIVNSLESPMYRDFSRSVLVASSTPEEGKTISASNLACMFAKSGKKTLLIDFDMRRPRLARIYRDAFDAAGESEEDRLQKSLLHSLHAGDPSRFSHLPLVGPMDGLDIITSQPSRDISAAEVMTSKSVRDLMNWAHDKYERVVIDSPPLGVISDSSVLASLVGCVLLVVRPEKSRKKLVKHMLEQFSMVGANVVGAIVNDLDLQKDNFFDSKYKYMSYSYQRSYNPNE